MKSVPTEQLANINGGYTPSPEAMAWLLSKLKAKSPDVTVLSVESTFHVVPGSGQIIP